MLKIIPSKFFGNIAIIATTVMLLLLYPYAVNNLLELVKSDYTTYFVSFAFFGIFWFFSPKKEKVPKAVVIFMVIQVIVWFFYYIGHRDGSYLTRIFFIILTYFICQVLVSYRSLDRYIKFNNNLLLLQTVCGAIAFVLVYAHILYPICTFPNMDSRLSTCYILTCSNAVQGNFIRAGGYFDEPGALAFWATYALLFNKLIFNNKKVEIGLLISLIFTFSAAFYIEAFIYLCLFYYHKIKQIIVVAFVVYISSYAMMKYLGDDDRFLWMTTERFSMKKGLRNNRESMTEVSLAQFKESPIFGIGARKNLEGEYSADNPYEILAKDGIVGYIVTYLPLFYLIFKCRRRDVTFAVIILMVDFMQRPFHVNEMHFLMMYIFVVQSLLKYKELGQPPTNQSNGYLQA